MDETKGGTDVNNKNGSDERSVFSSINDKEDVLETAEPRVYDVFLKLKKKNRPEVAWRILSLKNDDVEDETEARLEFREGHWVV